MEIRLFDLKRDEGKIDSFLDSASLAHKNERRSKEWFLWKFFGSPYGESILMCAFDNDCVVGCMGYGRARVSYNGKDYNAGLSYETFVRPGYQGGGLMKKMINAFFDHIETEKVFDVLWNFPNSNSIRGFLRTGWRPLEMPAYHLFVCRPLRFIRYGLDLRKGFRPEDSNWEELKDRAPYFERENISPKGLLVPVWSAEYMKWRFFTFPIARYATYDGKDFWGIARIGCRGRLREAQVLTIVPKADVPMIRNIRKFTKFLKKEENVDCVSICSTRAHSLGMLPLGFFKVPSTGNCCCYFPNSSSLRQTLSGETEPKFAFSGIDYHTY